VTVDEYRRAWPIVILIVSGSLITGASLGALSENLWVSIPLGYYVLGIAGGLGWLVTGITAIWEHGRSKRLTP